MGNKGTIINFTCKQDEEICNNIRSCSTGVGNPLCIGAIYVCACFGFFEPKIDGIQFQVTEGNGKLKTSVLFSLLLALIPIFVTITWRLGSITTFAKKLFSCLTILFFIIAGIFFRHQMVKTFFLFARNKIVTPGSKTDMPYPINPVNFVYYMFAGLCTGCIVSYIIFRRRTQ